MKPSLMWALAWPNSNGNTTRGLCPRWDAQAVMATRWNMSIKRHSPPRGRYVQHRFLRDGFWGSLSQHALLLYVFLVLVADRHGLSYYSFDKICALLQLSLDDYLIARNALIKKDLIAFDGHLFQVLALPAHPVLHPPAPLHSAQQMAQADPATIR